MDRAAAARSPELPARRQRRLRPQRRGARRSAALTRPTLSPRWLDDLGVVAMLAAVAAVCAFTGWTWQLDRLVYDRALAAWAPPPPADVLIVAIDDASIEAIGRWPWPRAVHATLLARLATAPPRAVALDLLLSEADADPRQDALLAEAMAQLGRVVLPVAWRTDGWRGSTLLAPIAALRPRVGLGAVDPAANADGVLRHGFLQAGLAGQPWPNLARALLEAGGEWLDPGLRTTFDQASAAADAGWRRDGRFPVRFAGPAGTFQTVSYVDLLRGAVPSERWAGRYLLIGATAQGLGDRQTTPVDDRGGAMHGVEVIANEFATLRGGRHVVELDAAPVAALSVGVLALLVVGMTRVGPRHALPLALATVPVAIAASFLLLRLGPWLAPTPFAIAALLAYPLWSWRRLERAVAGIDLGIEALSEAARWRPAGDAIATRLQVLRGAAEVVRDSRRFLADAIAALPTAMLLADDAQRVLLANARAASLFEVAEAGDLIGLDIGRLLQELTTPEPLAWTKVLAALRPDGPGLATGARLGDSVDLMLHVAALDASSGRRFIATLADIGPVRQAEREREEALGFVSHDLRAPAASIVLLADMNLGGAFATPRHELLAQVRELAARTLALAGAFVRASRAGSQPLERAPVALQALLDEAASLLGPAAAARGVRIELEADAAATAQVDRFLLGRALGNLLSNAVRHSPEGGVVQLRAAVAAGRLSLCVADRGPGLTAGQVERLRTQDLGAAVGDARGVGLGLVFVQRVARRHGGRLRVVESAAGRGTTFELEVESGSSGNS